MSSGMPRCSWFCICTRGYTFALFRIIIYDMIIPADTVINIFVVVVYLICAYEDIEQQHSLGLLTKLIYRN